MSTLQDLKDRVEELSTELNSRLEDNTWDHSQEIANIEFEITALESIIYNNEPEIKTETKNSTKALFRLPLFM